MNNPNWYPIKCVAGDEDVPIWKRFHIVNSPVLLSSEEGFNWGRGEQRRRVHAYLKIILERIRDEGNSKFRGNGPSSAT